MRPLFIIVLLTAVCAAQAPDQGVFRARTDLVVLEDDVPQKVLFFEPGERIPLAVVLLVDYSQSMDGEPLARAKAAAANFLDSLHPEDLVEVLAFNDQAARLYAMGADHAEASRAIQALEGHGMTRLYDAILVAQRDLERAERGAPGTYQKSIVILSDGVDTRSSMSFDDVLDDAKRNTTSVNAISVRADGKQQWLPPVREMTQLTFDTGGQTIAIRKLADISAAYECIGSDLRAQYRLGYVSSSPDKDGRWHRVSVRVKDHDLMTRTRSGYFATWAAATGSSTNNQ